MAGRRGLDAAAQLRPVLGRDLKAVLLAHLLHGEGQRDPGLPQDLPHLRFPDVVGVFGVEVDFINRPAGRENGQFHPAMQRRRPSLASRLGIFGHSRFASPPSIHFLQYVMTSASTSPTAALTAGELRAAFSATELFAGMEWRLSPAPWPVDATQLAFLEQLGQAILGFYHAVDTLYLRSAAGKSLLRNRVRTAPWVAELYDRGKPDWLVRHARHPRVQGRVPAVLRPDLLPTGSGFALTELDSVPGGIGLTAFLNALHEHRAGGPKVLGQDGAMLDNFFRAITRSHRQPDPVVALAVSEESASYRPEMEWAASRLRDQGRRVWCVSVNELILNDNGVHLPAATAGTELRADVVYRFFELFDHAAIPAFQPLLKLIEEGLVAVTPPLKPHLEEKLSLALFHHPELAEYWEEALNRRHRKLLASVIPPSWILETETLPPGAFWNGPTLRGRPLRSWRELGSASQKDRELILKVSGFDATAWGARGVTYGADVPGEVWRNTVDQALADSDSKVFIIQEFRKPALLSHPVCPAGSDEPSPQPGRLRLCPYYFPVRGIAHLSGALATFCPSDKKIIHGMEDAALVPVGLV